MLETKIQAVVLAAGKASRFKTNKTKLVEKICGQEMILYVTKLLEHYSIPTTVVVGYQAEVLQDILNKHHKTLTYVVQEEQRGTGHAVMITEHTWYQDHILIMNGDMPLINSDIISKLITKHVESNAAITFVAAHNDDPAVTGYGRVIKEQNSIKIVEAKDFIGNQHEQCCINAGIYLIRRDFLQKNIAALRQSAVTQEWYLTNLIEQASSQGYIVEIVKAPFDSVRGVNDLKELWAAEQIKRAILISNWMEQGVRFYTAPTVLIDLNIEIGAGTTIGSGVHILNGTKIGTHCTIGSFSILDHATIGDHVTIHPHSIISDSHINSNASIGPFAHVRSETVIQEQVTIGNFVEIKKSTIGAKTKAKHLSFIGDATIGSHVNIGAGTITCNYDGTTKHPTTIADGSFIGSNNTLIAPVTIGKDAYTAAGSVITNNVPQEALAIGRARQINKEGYAQALKEKRKPKHTVENSLPFIGAIKTTNDTTHKE